MGVSFPVLFDWHHIIVFGLLKARGTPLPFPYLSREEAEPEDILSFPLSQRTVEVLSNFLPTQEGRIYVHLWDGSSCQWLRPPGLSGINESFDQGSAHAP